MDLLMPRWDGVEATRRICARLPHVRIIINSDSEDEQHFVAAIRAGAYGYVTRAVGFDVLVKCIRSAARGEPAISRHHVKLLLSHLGAAPDGPDRPASPLTAREREVLRLLIEGQTYRGIAEALYITDHTVRTHVQNMQEKLALPNRAQLIRYAVANHLFDVAGPEPAPVTLNGRGPVATPAPASHAADAVPPKDAPEPSRPGP
jgi:two-component system NarL family response regulator